MVRPRRLSADRGTPPSIPHRDAASVFARAAELEAEHAMAASTTDDGLDEEELLEAAENAGLSPVAVRQALAELRTGAIGSDRSGLAPLAIDDRTWLGDRCVTAQRVVALSPGRCRAAAQRFLRQQLFELERDRAGRSTWRPRRGLVATVQRTAGGLLHRLALDGTVDPVALAVAEEPGSRGTRTLVRFEADLSPTRRSLRWGVGTGAGGVGLVGGLVAVVAVPGLDVLALAALPAAGAAAGGGVVVARRSYRERRDQVQACLEGFLDRLERDAS